MNIMELEDDKVERETQYFVRICSWSRIARSMGSNSLGVDADPPA